MQYVIIDEMSMLGLKIFMAIDKRLRQATGRLDEPFGGISMILIGDQGQLPPVKDTALFVNNAKHPNTQAAHLLYVQFNTCVILTQIQRQHADQNEFRDILMALRSGKITQQHLAVLNTRVITVASNAQHFGDNSPDVMHLYCKRKQVTEYNETRLNKLHVPCALIESKNTPASTKRASSDQCMGLENVVILADGALVVLTANLWSDAGLVNGAPGIIKFIVYAPGVRPPEQPLAVIVKFINYRGPSFLEDEQGCVPIVPIVAEFTNKKGSHCSRRQLPLRLGYSDTVHHMQGKTLSKCVIDLGNSEMTPGISFVALSRAKRITDVILLRPLDKTRFDKMRSKPQFQYRLREEKRLFDLDAANKLMFPNSSSSSSSSSSSTLMDDSTSNNMTANSTVNTTNNTSTNTTTIQQLGDILLQLDDKQMECEQAQVNNNSNDDSDDEDDNENDSNAESDEDDNDSDDDDAESDSENANNANNGNGDEDDDAEGEDAGHQISAVDRAMASLEPGKWLDDAAVETELVRMFDQFPQHNFRMHCVSVVWLTLMQNDANAFNRFFHPYNFDYIFVPANMRFRIYLAILFSLCAALHFTSLTHPHMQTHIHAQWQSLGIVRDRQSDTSNQWRMHNLLCGFQSFIRSK